MENFSHLLNQYIQRARISDAELSRAIGVSRQTIFRWREGMTARPRYREDVLAIARKLRLSAEERNQFLLAAPTKPSNAPHNPLAGQHGQIHFTTTWLARQGENRKGSKSD